ncbi:MAG: ABC transporter ATP-binding protein [Acidimicrobiales bacterium]
MSTADTHHLPANVQAMTDAPPAIRAQRVSKVFGHGTHAVTALDGVDLTVRASEFVCIVGASGCGKTTLLNLASSLDAPTSGRFETHGQVAVMFQQDALFPWLTVSGNIELALELRGINKAARKARADELLASVRLEGYGHRRPHELSGGMRQRVALARALAQDADVLLMDEPFGALDAMTRDLMHDELERVWSDRHLAILFVTHNVREAVRLGDRVLLLSSRPGRVVEEFAVPIDRPRRIEAADVSELAGEITARLREEVRRHART